MHSFTDACGRVWSIVLNVAEIGRMRQQGVDLLGIWDGGLLEKLANDPVFLGDTLYLAVQHAAETSGVSREEFSRALHGDVLDEALNALLEELADFFPRWKRDLLMKLIEKLRAVQTTLAAEAMARLDDDDLSQAAKSAARNAGS